MECLSPIRLKSGLVVPCGKCPACLANHRQELVFRLRAEYDNCLYGYFVTLTYDDDHLPIKIMNKFGDKKYIGVNKRDVQLFLKRFRKLVGNRSFRYFICAEYGDHTLRPHYHALLFFSVDIKNVEEKIVKCWHNGFCQFGNIEEASIVYCTKYQLKLSKVPPGMNDIFTLSSRRPGIGFNYYEKLGSYHIANENLTQANLHGISCRMPRYYKDKMIKDIDSEALKAKLAEMSYLNTLKRAERKKQLLKKKYGINFDSSVDPLNDSKKMFDMCKGLVSRQNENVLKHIKKQKL